MQSSDGEVRKGCCWLYRNLPEIEERSAGSVQCPSQRHAAAFAYEPWKSSSFTIKFGANKTSWPAILTNWSCIFHIIQINCKAWIRIWGFVICCLLTLLKTSTACKYVVVSLSHWIGGIFSHLGHISSSWWEYYILNIFLTYYSNLIYLSFPLFWILFQMCVTAVVSSPF